jgi:hypothetical protein
LLNQILQKEITTRAQEALKRSEQQPQQVEHDKVYIIEFTPDQPFGEGQLTTCHKRKKLLHWLVASLGAVAIFVSYWCLNFLENRIEVGAGLGIAVVFIFIAAYSRYLGLYWSRLLAGITATLGLL